MTIGLRGVDRTIGLVVSRGMWLKGRLGAYALRSSIHLFSVEYMGCGQWEIYFGELVAMWSCHTTSASGCGGAMMCVVPAFRARRSSNIGYYLCLGWCSAVNCRFE